MKKTVLSGISLILAAALLSGCGGSGASWKGSTAEETAQAPDAGAATEPVEESQPTAPSEQPHEPVNNQTADQIQEPGSRGSSEHDKEETVYIKADASGRVREVSVETVLNYSGDGGRIRDRSLLTDIRNTEGDEEFSVGSGGELIWEDHGEKIRYEGKSTEVPPVGVKISCTLNGAEISPEELAGRSGHLVMRFDYENSTVRTEQVSIYGNAPESIETRVPFLAMTVAVLPKDVFSNVTAKNGKILDVGDQRAFLGLALPGVPESLTLKDYKLTEELEIPTWTQLEADVTDFHLDFTATIFSNGLMEDLEQKNLDELYDFAGDMESLYWAAADIAEGSENFGDGMSAYVGTINGILMTIKEFAEELPELQEEVERIAGEFAEVQSALTDTPQNLQDTGEALSQIREELAELLTYLEGINGAGETAASEISAASSDTGDAQATVWAAEDALSRVGTEDTAVNGIDMLWAEVCGTEGLFVSGTDALRAEAETIADDALRESVLGLIDELAVSGTDGLWAEVYGTENLSASGSITGMAEVEAALSTAETALSGAASHQEAALDAAGSISIDEDSLNLIREVIAGLETAEEQLAAAEGALAEIQDSAILQGVVEELDALWDSLEESEADFTVEDLPELLQSMADAGTGLNTAAHQLEKANAEFRDGIEKLSDLGGWRLRRFARQLDAMRIADQSYFNFGGIADGRSGSVRFIIETDQIG